VPRETRRQRRDARRAAGESARPRAVAVPAGGASETAVEPIAQPRRRGRFIAELRKVEWPTRPHVIQGTVAVIIACLIVGAYLWGVDQVLRPFVRDVLLGQ
jgi:preprotein translocase SecE subunit